MLKIKDAVLKHWRFAVPAAVVITLALLYFLNQPRQEAPLQGFPEELVDKGEQKEVNITQAAETKLAFVTIDIKGEVRDPGVFEMKQGDRVIHAVEKAGGFTSKADQRNVNLSGMLKDEMLIYIPRIGEKGVEVQPAANETAEAVPKININTALEPELENLNGIGPSKAKAILVYREENGPFKAVEDLLNVPGIGDKSLENMREQIIIQ